MDKESEGSGPEIAKLINDHLEQERTLKTSFETRAMSVVTSSGSLVTLLFALGALATRSASYSLPMVPRILIGVALGAFLVAAVAAIVVLRPMNYAHVATDSLRELTAEDAWNAPVYVGAPRIAAVQVEAIDQARQTNAVKGRWLGAAVVAEVIAISALASAVGVILATS